MEKTENELIAEFLGCKPIFEDKERIGYHIVYGFRNGATLSSALEYHKSWDWLMPVVEKIESIGYKFATCRRRIDVYSDNGKNWLIVSVKEETKIQSAYKAIVEFIKWHNSQKS